MHPFGFNSKLNDREWGGQLVQDYGARLYNPAICRFLSVDPLSPSFPWFTPYQFAGNGPIENIDLDGLENIRYDEEKQGGVTTQLTITRSAGPRNRGAIRTFVETNINVSAAGNVTGSNTIPNTNRRTTEIAKNAQPTEQARIRTELGTPPNPIDPNDVTTTVNIPNQFDNGFYRVTRDATGASLALTAADIPTQTASVVGIVTDLINNGVNGTTAAAVPSIAVLAGNTQKVLLTHGTGANETAAAINAMTTLQANFPNIEFATGTQPGPGGSPMAGTGIFINPTINGTNTPLGVAVDGAGFATPQEVQAVR